MRWLSYPSRSFRAETGLRRSVLTTGARISLIVAIALGHCLLSGSCLAALINVEPDLFPAGTDIRNSYPGVTLSVNVSPPFPFFLEWKVVVEVSARQLALRSLGQSQIHTGSLRLRNFVRILPARQNSFLSTSLVWTTVT